MAAIAVFLLAYYLLCEQALQAPGTVLFKSVSDSTLAVLHINSNALFAWRDTPLNLFSYLSNTSLSILSSLVFGLGIGCMALSVARVSLLFSSGVALGSGALSLYFFGFDPIVLSVLCWTPYCLLAIRSFCRSSGIDKCLSGLLVLLTSGLLALSANQLALPIAVFFLATLPSFRLEQKTPGSAQFALLCALLLLPAGIGYLIQSSIELPTYPKLAHLVPDDNIPGHISALLGPSSNLAIIDREQLKDTYAAVAVSFFAVTLLAFVLCRKHRRSKHLISLAALLAGVALMDLVTPEEIAQIAPLAALSRVIPGLFILPLGPIVLALVLPLFFLGLLSAGRSLQVLLASSAVAILASFSFEGAETSSFFGKRFYSKSQVQSTLTAQSTPPGLRGRLVSPSFRLINEHGGRTLFERDLFTNPLFEPLPEDVRITTSGGSANKALLRDNDDHTRWSSGAKSQHDAEWIHLQFAQTETLDGIELATGAWRWDFPRGLEVRASLECPPEISEAAFQTYTPVRDASSWQGKVKFSESGEAYYGGQDQVEVIFPRTIEARCLLIRQSSQHPVYQWSVAELRILRKHQFP